MKPILYFTIKYFILLSLFLTHLELIAQLGPAPPALKSVSVNYENGDVIIQWYPSVSPDVQSYNVKIIRDFLGHPTYENIVTGLPATDTMYIYTLAAADTKSDGYSVSAVNDSDVEGIYSAIDSTVFLAIHFDSCNATIELEWNDYNSWRDNIDTYHIYSKTNGGDFTLLTSLNEGQNNYTIQNPTAKTDFYFYVETVHNDGRTSTSNQATTYTQMRNIPEYLQITSMETLNEEQLEFTFQVDPNTEIFTYHLKQASSPVDEFTIITDNTFYESTFTQTIETNANEVSYYKIESINNCNTAVKSSNTWPNLVLGGENNGLVNTLAWNTETEQMDSTTRYLLFRKTGTDEYPLQAYQTLSTTSFMDNIEPLMDPLNPPVGNICYYIEFIKTGNIATHIISNEVCLAITPDIKFPNAFTPNDDSQNDNFGPIMSIIPKEFTFIIFNRWGSKVFETNQLAERWTGNGFPEGTYGYSLRVVTYDNQVIEKQGYVTLISP